MARTKQTAKKTSGIEAPRIYLRIPKRQRAAQAAAVALSTIAKPSPGAMTVTPVQLTPSATLECPAITTPPGAMVTAPDPAPLNALSLSEQSGGGGPRESEASSTFFSVRCCRSPLCCSSAICAVMVAAFSPVTVARTSPVGAVSRLPTKTWTTSSNPMSNSNALHATVKGTLNSLRSGYVLSFVCMCSSDFVWHRDSTGTENLSFLHSFASLGISSSRPL